MSREAYRVVAPITQGVRDVFGLFPRVKSDAFSDQVAQVVEAQGELERQKKDKKRSLLSRALLNTALGTGVGAALGAMKSIPITRDVWNPNVAATTAALSGATALAFTLARHALAPRLTSEAQETIDQADPAVRYVAGHSRTKERAKEWERAQWAPYMAGEGGAILGGLGALGGAWALGKPNSLSTGLAGAGLGAAAGLGLGYLYRKRKQKQFLEHVENELAMSQSPKAQEATLQAEVEQDPMLKAAAMSESEAARRRRNRYLAIAGVALGGTAATAGALSNMRGISGFKDLAKEWSTGDGMSLEQVPTEYAVHANKALTDTSVLGLSPSTILKAHRSAPWVTSEQAWRPTSQLHYDKFKQGPLVAYLHMAREVEDPDMKFNRDIRDTTETAFDAYRRGEDPKFPDWYFPKGMAAEGRERLRQNVLYNFERIKAALPAEAKPVQGRTGSRQGGAAPRQGEVLRTWRADIEDRLRSHAQATARRIFGKDDISQLSRPQQETVLRALDRDIKATSSEDWTKKQLHDVALGLVRVTTPGMYTSVQPVVTALRDAAVYGGLAMAALGGGVLLKEWLDNRKREKKEREKVIQFPKERLEKAAMSLVKEALITGSGWPVVSTNAPLLNGNGGAPERYASGKHGVRRIYDYGLGAVEAWKSSAKPQLEKHVQTEKLAEDDPNAHGEELDDVALSICRVLEEQHGPKVKDDPPPSTEAATETPPSAAATTEAAPSTKVAAVDLERAKLPYRKRVEVYAMKDGKIYGGVYKDGGFGVYGGGFDDDDVRTAAEREFAEETGLVARNVRLLPVEPVKIDWNPPYKSEKQAERAKQFRGAQTFFVIADLDDSNPTEKAEGDDGKSLLRWPRLYTIDEARELCKKTKTDDEGVETINAARLQVLDKLGFEKVADAAQFLPRKEVLVFTPDGKIAIRRGQNRRFELPSDVEGKPVPYEQPVQLLPEGGVPEPGVHGYQVTLHSADGELPEGFEGVDPQDALKDLYAALGQPINRQFQSLDRARARAILRLVKKRAPAPAAV